MVHKRRKIVALALSVSLVLSASVQGLRASALQYTGTESYMSGKYYRQLRKVALTGDPRTDIVAVARSQVGYQEGASNNQLSGEIYGGVNHTEFGAWYGMQDQWCAMFVSWCANVADVSTQTVPSHCYTPDGLSWFAERGLAYSREEIRTQKYTPRPGDLIYFKSPRTAKPTNHVGLVTGYSNGRIYTIEGNVAGAGKLTNGGMVTQKSYPISNGYIAYICAPNYSQGSTNVASERQVPTELESLRSALIALETGDGLCYDRVTPVGNRSLAIGCGQWYGPQAKALLRQLRSEAPELFEAPDCAELSRCLDNNEPLTNSLPLRTVLASPEGIRVQNKWMDRCLEDWMCRAEALGVTDRDGLLLCAALYQLRGSEVAEALIRQAGEAPNRQQLLSAVARLEPGLLRTCSLLCE